MEKFISSERIYEGKIINIRKDTVRVKNDNVAYREIVEHNGGSSIALKNNEGKFYLVKQYRYGQKENTLEFVAGKLEKGEDPTEAIERETIEESGYSVKHLRYFGYMMPTPAYAEEKIYLYYGETDKYFGQDLDEDEDIELLSFSLEELTEMVKTNQIKDAKTIALVYYIKLHDLA
jgi:ADP-ribose pyrophosphatase